MIDKIKNWCKVRNGDSFEIVSMKEKDSKEGKKIVTWIDAEVIHNGKLRRISLVK